MWLTIPRIISPERMMTPTMRPRLRRRRRWLRQRGAMSR
jgi:hypothetical protein